LVEYGEHWKANHQKRISDLLEFVQQHATVVPADSIINFPPDQLELHDEYVPESFLKVVAAASDYAVPFLCECAHHRQQALILRNVDGLSTLGFVESWAQKQLITPDQELNAWMVALDLNVRYVRPSDSMIEAAVKADAYTLGYRTKYVMQAVSYPEITAYALGDVLSALTKEVWLHSPETASRAELIQAFFALIATHKDHKTVVRIYLDRLHHRFGPLATQHILAMRNALLENK
jgi:hypothetical protein